MSSTQKLSPPHFYPFSKYNMPCLGCLEEEVGCCGCIPSFRRLRRSSQDPTSPQAQQPPSNPYTEQIIGQNSSGANHGQGLRRAQGFLAAEARDEQERILALLAQFPYARYTSDATALIERIIEKFQPWVERGETLFNIETSFMISPRWTTQEAPYLDEFLLNLINGYNNQKSPLGKSFSTRVGPENYQLGIGQRAPPGFNPRRRIPHPNMWHFYRITERNPIRPRVGHGGNYFSATIENMVVKLTMFYSEGHFTLARFSCIAFMARRRSRAVEVFGRSLCNSGSPPF
jgi:hypothetical protein